MPDEAGCTRGVNNSKKKNPVHFIGKTPKNFKKYQKYQIIPKNTKKKQTKKRNDTKKYLHIPPKKKISISPYKIPEIPKNPYNYLKSPNEERPSKEYFPSK